MPTAPLIYEPSPLSSRNQFGPWLKKLGLTVQAAEVGTHRGEFAKILLEGWPGTLWCVDPWAVPPGYERQATMLWTEGESPSREKDYQKALSRLGPFGDRARLIRELSQNTAATFAADSLDFVYLDGDHRRAEVYRDLVAWWGKLRIGGIMAGHDVVCPGEIKGGWGKNVQSALTDFMIYLADSPKYTGKATPPVGLIVEEGGLPWSFHFQKGCT